MQLRHLKNDPNGVLRNKTYKYVKSIGVAAIFGLVCGVTILLATPSTTVNAVGETSTSVQKDATVEVPEQITKEGIVAQGLDGTAPYYVTEPVKGKGYNLYFLDGTLGEFENGASPTQTIINSIQGGSISGVAAGTINKVDTSLAQNAVVAPKDSSYLFANLSTYNPAIFDSTHADLNLSKLDTSNTENMTQMFSGSKLSNSDLSTFDTSKVTNMTQMFSGSVLDNLDLSKFNTSEVTHMDSMFQNVELIDNKLDLSSFNTSKVTSMDSMFRGLHLQLGDDKVDLNLSSFDTSGIEGEGLKGMFYSARIKNLILDNFKNPNGKITSLENMFSSASIDKISMKNFDTSTISSFYGTFSFATIGDLDISNFDMTKIENQSANMFQNATITSITLGPKNKFDRLDENGDLVDTGSGIDEIINNPDKETNINYDFKIPTTVDGKGADDTTITFSFKGTTEAKVTVPTKSGYTSNVSEFTASLNKYGAITVTPTIEGLTIKYTKKSSSNNNHNSGGGSNTNNNHQESITPTDKKQLVATYPDRGSVTLYKLENNKFTQVGNRALSKASDWYSDKLADTKDMTYYRVASNEWVKASDLYVYEPVHTIYNTKSEITYLLNSHNSTVSNRALSPETSWSIDRIGYLGDYKNPIKAYRVASNEFVKY